MHTFYQRDDQSSNNEKSHSITRSLNWKFSQLNLEEEVLKFIHFFVEQAVTVMQVGDCQSSEFKPYRHYLVDHRHERLLVIFKYLTINESWEYYDASYRLFDPIKQYEEAQALSAKDQEKVKQLRKQMGQVRVYEVDPSSPEVFQNYFQALLKVPQLKFDARLEDESVHLSFDLSNPAWLDIFSHYNPYVKERTDFSLEIKIDANNQRVYAIEDYRVKREDKEDLHTQYIRQFQLTDQQLPPLGAFEAISSDSFDEKLKEIGLPLY